MKRLHTALILAIGFVFVLGSLLAQVPISTSGAPHWQEKMKTSDSDCTPIEATDPRAVQWFAIGT